MVDPEHHLECFLINELFFCLCNQKLIIVREWDSFALTFKNSVKTSFSTFPPFGGGIITPGSTTGVMLAFAKIQLGLYWLCVDHITSVRLLLGWFLSDIDAEVNVIWKKPVISYILWMKISYIHLISIIEHGKISNSNFLLWRARREMLVNSNWITREKFYKISLFYIVFRIAERKEMPLVGFIISWL